MFIIMLLYNKPKNKAMGIIGKEEFFRINKDINDNLVEEFQKFIDNIDSKKDLQKGSFIHLVFDTHGGSTNSAFRFIDLMKRSGYKFYGVAYGRVDSSAATIFSEADLTIIRSENVSALIHRAVPVESNVSTEDFKITEDLLFTPIANKLNINLEQVYDLADKNTVITIHHKYGPKFFLGQEIAIKSL